MEEDCPGDAIYGALTAKAGKLRKELEALSTRSREISMASYREKGFKPPRGGHPCLKCHPDRLCNAHDLLYTSNYHTMKRLACSTIEGRRLLDVDSDRCSRRLESADNYALLQLWRLCVRFREEYDSAFSRVPDEPHLRIIRRIEKEATICEKLLSGMKCREIPDSVSAAARRAPEAKLPEQGPSSSHSPSLIGGGQFATLSPHPTADESSEEPSREDAESGGEAPPGRGGSVSSPPPRVDEDDMGNKNLVEKLLYAINQIPRSQVRTESGLLQESTLIIQRAYFIFLLYIRERLLALARTHKKTAKKLYEHLLRKQVALRGGKVMGEEGRRVVRDQVSGSYRSEFLREDRMREELLVQLQDSRSSGVEKWLLALTREKDLSLERWRMRVRETIPGWLLEEAIALATLDNSLSITPEAVLEGAHSTVAELRAMEEDTDALDDEVDKIVDRMDVIHEQILKDMASKGYVQVKSGAHLAKWMGRGRKE